MGSDDGQGDAPIELPWNTADGATERAHRLHLLRRIAAALRIPVEDLFASASTRSEGESETDGDPA